MPTASISYYKKVVQELEAFREQLKGLPLEQQLSFLKSNSGIDRSTVVDLYRELADLLIEQGRIAEAQQILELLKITEINNFTKGTRAPQELPDLALTKTEQDIQSKESNLVAFGKQLKDCERTQCKTLKKLQSKYDRLTQTFDQQLQAIEDKLANQRLEQVSVGTQDFIAGAEKLLTAQPDTMLIYPLVLKDKVRLLWASEGGVFSSQTCPVGEAELWQQIATFREQLSRPNSRISQVNTTGKQLYECLIKPLESELEAGNIKNLVFVPDRATNYIPMGALYDGEQYLIEKYTTTSVLSANLTDVSDRLPTNPKTTSTLALGLSQAVAGFTPLANVPEEIDSIVKQGERDQGIYPGLEFLNQAFNTDNLRNNLKGQKILHIATHGEFVPQDPKASYLLMGTGEKLPIYQIQFLRNLRDIHLVVLSACETALGGPDQNGVEIAGISSYFLRDKAKAVLASLWQVNDASTNQLMQAFYKNLAQNTQQNPVTKAEAIRLAQLNLLSGQSETKASDDRGGIEVRDRNDNQPEAPSSAKFSHPYYWAPFTLIGNGL